MLFEELDTGRFERSRMLHAKLTGLRESCVSRSGLLTQRVADAKGRLELVEQCDTALESLQNRAHRRSVGAFEKLLTAIVRDVLPEKGEVRLNLYQERGAPALDVQMANGDAIEDAFDGSGGAVTNVLSAGLRFAALSRTGARRLVVLDEPDCWIKPERVAGFVRVLSDVARRAGTQTVLISHHEPELFEDLVSLVKLTRGADGSAEVQVMRRAAEWPDEAAAGLRSIHLKNFRAHSDTLVPLFPGVTVVIGDNDLGKSTLAATSLRAVAYGDGDDTLIRHGAPEAQVTLELENGRRIVWTRRAKAKSGQPKVNYALYEAGSDEPVREGRPATRGGVPEWVSEVLGIARAGELDIQVGSQKSPVFLLDRPASMRAQILSVGRESGRLSSLIERYGELKRADRAQVRDGESELAALAQKLAVSENLPSVGETLERLAEDLKNIEAARALQSQLVAVMDRIESLEKHRQRASACATALAGLPEMIELHKTQPLSDLIGRIDSLAKHSQRASACAAALAEVPEMIELHPTQQLTEVIGRIERNEPKARARVPGSLPDVPQLHDTAAIALAGQRIGRLQKQLEGRKPLPQMPDIPQLHELSGLVRLAGAVSSRATDLERLKAALQEADQALTAAHAEEAAVIEEIGGMCPLCGGELHA